MTAYSNEALRTISAEVMNDFLQSNEQTQTLRHKGQKMKVLVVVPSLKLVGGVSFHYQGLRPHWASQVEYVEYGKRPHWHAAWCLLPDFLHYLWKLLMFRPDVVIVNPSFRSYQLKRDGFYLWVAKLIGFKIVAMFHGWDFSYSQRMKEKPSCWIRIFSHCSFIYVLCSDFKRELRNMGIKVPILPTTTQVSDDLVKDHICQPRTEGVRNILYLARVDQAKGIFETLDAFRMVHDKYPYVRLNVCGSSEDEVFVDEVKHYVQEEAIPDVTFHGAVFGEAKRRAFSHNDLYILPSYGEGLATSVLEAMAFGLPVLSNPVGGIKDFFVNGKMGFLVDKLVAAHYAEKIIFLIEHPEVYNAMREYVSAYARSHFMASVVAARYEKDITTYCLSHDAN